MSDTPLSSYLRMLREKNNFTQDDIAKVLGTSRANYSHYENARITPSNDSLCKLADFYNIPLTKFVRLAGSSFGADNTDLTSFIRSTKDEGYDNATDKYFNEFLSECGGMRMDELAKWLSLDDRELVYYYHHLSNRDKRIVIYMLKLMLLNKDINSKR